MKCPNCSAEANGKYCEYCGCEMPKPSQTVNITNNYYRDRDYDDFDYEFNEDGDDKLGRCPKCNSSRICFKREQVSTYSQTQVRKQRGGSSTSRTSYRTVGLCQKCGYTWDPNSPTKSIPMRTNYNSKQNNYIWLWVLGWLFFFPAPVMVLIWRKKCTWDIKIKIGVTVAFWIMVLVLGSTSNSSKSTTTQSTVDNGVAENNDLNSKSDDSIWAVEQTSIDDFDYYIDGTELHIKKYRGKEKKINVAATYNIEGKDYNVVEMDSTFALGRISSCILPEGLRIVSSNLFNSSDVKYIYLPSTVSIDNRFVGYFHNVEKLYYGGSETQWKSMITEDRGDIGIKQIIYDANDNLEFSPIPATKKNLDNNEMVVVTNGEPQGSEAIIPSGDDFKFTPITDFWIGLDDASHTITLRAYNTHDKVCYVSPTYIIDGETYSVDSVGTDACFFGRTSLETCSIPNGVKIIPGNTFNSSSVKNIILPISIEDVSGTSSYMRSLEKIYYAGTEEQWNAIKGASEYTNNVEIFYEMSMPDVADGTNYNRADLETERSDAEQLGAGAANALNGFIKGFSEGLEE